MKCREAREEMIARAHPAPAVQRHIDDCEECRSFYADLQAIRVACDTTVETPPRLRARTLERCQELLRERGIAGETSRWQRCLRALKSPRVVAGAAVLGVVVLMVATAAQIDRAQNEAVSMSLKLTVFFVVAQNVFTALFLPALLLFKDKLGGTRPRAVRTGE